MNKKIAVLATAVILIFAVPAFAADSQDNQPAPGYCSNNPDRSGCNGPGQCGQPKGHGGNCWRN